MLLILSVNTCSFAGGGVNQYNWISINMIIVLAFLTIAGLIYALSNLLPPRTMSKLKSISRFEMAQVVISLIIIIAIAGLASLSCNFTNSIAGMDTFEAAEVYIAKLLYVNGINLAAHIYSTSIEFMVVGEIARYASVFLSGSKELEAGAFKASVSISPDIYKVYSNYADLIVSYNIFVIVTFGMLFLMFLSLFIVKGIMLTVVLPVAIAMRSLAFFGPRLREAANSFLALAIAFYFIFPLTFVMDSYIVNWTYCTGSLSSCNPYYSSYPVSYTSSSMPPSSLFTANPQYTVLGLTFNVPLNFYSSAFVSGVSTQALYPPFAVGTISQEVADFLFQGIVLMALDLGITAAFAKSLTNALNSGFGIRGESLWS
jgi:hypothetical protein